jgi:hypothetical protein
MSEPPNISPVPPNPSGGLFTEPPRERSFPTAAVVLAAAAVVVVVAVLLVVGRHKPAPSPTTVQPLAAYASSLEVSNLQASESESLSGGKSTYVDGHIVNHGGQTVTGITVQALFSSGAGQPPQVMTVPLSLVRTREPYIDTEPVSSAPLAPGTQADFRLIFEGVGDGWNEQTPAVHIIQVVTR